jgi:hypothetical protein
MLPILILGGLFVAWIALGQPSATPKGVPLPPVPLPPTPSPTPGLGGILPQRNPGFISPGESYEITFGDAFARNALSVQAAFAAAGWNVLNFLDLGILPPSPLLGGDVHAYYAYATLADGRPLIPFNAAGNGGLSDLGMIAMSGPTLHPLGPTIPGQTS